MENNVVDFERIKKERERKPEEPQAENPGPTETEIEVFVCTECSSELWYIVRDGHVCHGCGALLEL